MQSENNAILHDSRQVSNRLITLSGACVGDCTCLHAHYLPAPDNQLIPLLLCVFPSSCGTRSSMTSSSASSASLAWRIRAHSFPRPSTPSSAATSSRQTWTRPPLNANNACLVLLKVGIRQAIETLCLVWKCCWTTRLFLVMYPLSAAHRAVAALLAYRTHHQLHCN